MSDYDPRNPQPVAEQKLPRKTKVEKAEEASSNAIAVGQLRAFIERIERLEEEKKTIGDDVKEVTASSKAPALTRRSSAQSSAFVKKKTVSAKRKRRCFNSTWMLLACREFVQ